PQPVVMELFGILSAPIAKLFVLDLARYGARRKERLAASNPVAATVRDVATALGFNDVDVYLSARYPHVAIAEPASPVSLVVGGALVHGSPVTLRSATGGALALARFGLAVPARLSTAELGVLGLAVLRLSRPELTRPG